ncbi:glycoside hydrolase family 18 protein [Pasteuria penetrans]|uniref:glycoside hydrolase family 18 protein n=1 Tax=Pasteuria penetrans TaxID=86005 RepID=UPI000FA86777|nr:glycosyl hydrolase family 18 protein [Pasteuria penetrans]
MEEGKEEEQGKKNPKRIVAYYPYWVDKKNKPEIYELRLPSRLTHLIYALARVQKEGKITPSNTYIDMERPFYGGGERQLLGNYGQLAILKQRYPKLSLLLLLAGSPTETEGGFAAAAATPESRQQFCWNVIQYLRRWSIFDGIDIDWEFPTEHDNPQSGGELDRVNFTLLMKTLRDYLSVEEKRARKPYLLSASLGAYIHHVGNIEADKIAFYSDWVTIMTYDFHSTAHRTTGHNTPLYNDPCAPEDHYMEKHNVSSAIQRYIKAGVPPEKIHMDLAFYGCAWGDCCPRYHGEYQRSTLLPKYSTEDREDPGTLDQPLIHRLIRKGAHQYWNQRARVPFLWDPKYGVFVTYEDTISITTKVCWGLRHQLGGFSCWTLGDDPQQILLRTVTKTVKKCQRDKR